MADKSPRPKGALALWYKKPETEKEISYLANLNLDQKVNLARAMVEQYREENRSMNLGEVADDKLFMKLMREEQERTKSEYDRRHMMRSAIQDYQIPPYEQHKVYNEIQKRQAEIDKVKMKGESEEDTLKRLEKEEYQRIIQALKADWNSTVRKEDPLVKEARAKVAQFRSSNPMMCDVPDEMLWERMKAEAEEAEVAQNNAEGRTAEDVIEENEARTNRACERRRVEINKAKKKYEEPKDVLLRLERMDEERIRLALRADWNDRVEN